MQERSEKAMQELIDRLGVTIQGQYILFDSTALLGTSGAIRKAFRWIVVGTVIMLASSVLWNLGYTWLEWLWIPGFGVLLIGLAALRNIYKKILRLSGLVRKGKGM